MQKCGCSPVNFMYIFRTPFPRNTSGWLLLNLTGTCFQKVIACLELNTRKQIERLELNTRRQIECLELNTRKQIDYREDH